MFETTTEWRNIFPQITAERVLAYRVYDENGHIGWVAFEWLDDVSVSAHLQFDRYSLSVHKIIARGWKELKQTLKSKGVVRIVATYSDDIGDAEVWKKFIRILKLEPPKVMYASITEV